MKALVLTRYGGPEAAELRDVARPSPGPGEVLVKVAASALNPVDFKIREGKLKPVLRIDLPAIMGNELAGTVVETGSGVTRFAVGDRVFARTAKDAMGAFAEYAVVAESLLAAIPDSLDFARAAAIPLAGLTALQALRDEAALGPGSRVFIPGGAGGVGTFAIQIAKWLGAEVVTTASPRGRDLVERLGADTVIDYTAGPVEDGVGVVDAVFDLIGGETLNRAFALVKKGGVVVSVNAMPEPQTARKDLDRGLATQALFWVASLALRLRAARHGARYRFLFMRPSGPELAELAALAEAGTLVPVIDRSFPFDRIKEALAYLETGRAKGKVVILMDG